MEFKGVVKEATSYEITLRVKDSVNVSDLKQKAINGFVYGVFEVYERDTITELQRKHFYALLGDYSKYTGVPLDTVESYFKFKFMQEEGLDELPSVARNKMTKSTATDFLTFVITYLIQNGVPFRKQQFYLTVDQSKMLYALTMQRICWICGKPHSEAHHATGLVGMGRNRSRHDHLQSSFMTLCREHHNEIHTSGLTEFCNKYHVKPIKLDKEAIKQLGL